MKTNEIENKEMPAVFRTLIDELIANWDRFDTAARDVFRKDEREMTRFELRDKYGYSHNFYTSDKELHERNAKAAEKSVQNMLNRVRKITGPVKEFKGIYVSNGELNGVVVGENGSASVQTVVAGGHSVQRLHVRVLVHKLK